MKNHMLAVHRPARRRASLAPGGRRSIAGLAALLLLGTVAGVSATAPRSGDVLTHTDPVSQQQMAPGQIEIVSLYPDDAPDSRNLALTNAEFSAKFPGSTAILNFPGGQLADSITNRWLAGDPPEVNYGFFHGTPQAWDYAAAGQLYDLTAAMSEPLDGYGDATWMDSILPGIRGFTTYPADGKAYAVPRELQTYQFFYNKKLFSANGISVPTTWDEFLAACATLKAAGIEPLAVSGPTQPYTDIYYSYLLARMADPVAVQAALDGKARFKDVPGALDAATELERLLKEGYFQSGFEGTDFTAAQMSFLQGKQAMMLMGSWLFGEMKDSIPVGFDSGIFSFPVVDGGHGDPNAVIGGVVMQQVAAQSKRPELGAEWLRLQAAKASQDRRTVDLGYLSAYDGAAVPAGFDSTVADLQAGGRLILEDWGGYAAVSITQAQRDAYGLPISALFLGQSSAAEMVDAIDTGLARFWDLP